MWWRQWQLRTPLPAFFVNNCAVDPPPGFIYEGYRTMWQNHSPKYYLLPVGALAYARHYRKTGDIPRNLCRIAAIASQRNRENLCCKLKISCRKLIRQILHNDAIIFPLDFQMDKETLMTKETAKKSSLAGHAFCGRHTGRHTDRRGICVLAGLGVPASSFDRTSCGSGFRFGLRWRIYRPD